MPRMKNASGRVLALLLSLLVFFAAAQTALAESAPSADRYDPENPQNLTDDDVTGKAAFVMDAQSGIVLYDKNGDRKAFPASTTKIMTCLIALERCDPQEMVTIAPAASQVPSDSSKTPVVPGEEMTLIDLLYGMMIKSGNDAAVAVACHVAGSEAAFVDLMNQRARELGCKNTHFVNSHGYHNEEHVSTAHDLALIAQAAMRNPTFREIVSAKSYTMAPTKVRNKLRLETSNSMYVASSKFYYPDLVGVKTGLHSKAGHCFVGAAEKDGAAIISVTLKTNSDGRWRDTMRLMNYADTRYEVYTFDQLYAASPSFVSVGNAVRTDENSGLLALTVVPGGALDTYAIKCLPEEYPSKLAEFSANLVASPSPGLVAPVAQGDIVGTLTLNTPGGPLTSTVIASRDIQPEPTPFSLESLLPGLGEHQRTLTIVLIAAGVIAVILVTVRIRVSLRNKRRRQEMLRRRRAAYDRYRAQ